MEPILSQALSQLFAAAGQAIATELVSQLSDPQKLEQTLTSLFGGGCHDNVDVAQDALDAYQAGHLSKDQCLRIVQICLEKKHPGKTIDIETLEALLVK